MGNWFDGNGNPVEYLTILDQIEEHHLGDGTVYIGSDSHLHSHGFILSSAIVLHGAEDQRGGKYYVSSTKLDKNSYHSLAERILAETEKTIMIAHDVVALFPEIKIELHIDVSNTDKNEATSNLAKTVIGYVSGNGFSCKVKPNAFAAASVADKHTK